MVSRGLVRIGDTDIEYDVRRSARRKKTVQITVDGAGVQVSAPKTTPESELQAIVRKRAGWILRNAQEAALKPSPKRFVSGETLPYLGRNVRLVVEVVDVPTPEVRFDHWRASWYPKVWNQKIVISASGVRWWSGTKPEPPTACGPAFNAGGSAWATEANSRY